MTMTVQTNKARAELGWAPRSIDHSLREILADELTRRGKKLPVLLEGVSPQAR
jgi:hypothetical protein